MSSCCGGDLGVDNALNSVGIRDVARVEELQRAGHLEEDGTVRYVISVPDVHCGACISAIERGLIGPHHHDALASLQRLAYASCHSIAQCTEGLPSSRDAVPLRQARERRMPGLG